MTKHDLKELAAIGSELGAAKAEIEALREQVKVLQSDANSWQSGYDKGRRDGGKHRKSEVERLRGEIARAVREFDECDAFNAEGRAVELMEELRAALSPQAEPADTFTAVDMATAAAQGFRDGQAAVEQAPAQDERDPIEKAAFDARLRRDFEARWPVPKGVTWAAGVGDYCVSEFASGIALSYPDMWMAYRAGAERQSMKYVPECLRNLPPQKSKSADSKRRKSARDIAGMTIAQTEQQPEQSGLVDALRFYANGDHLLFADADAWDTCSGEPMNWLHDEAGTASVEDGSIAKRALAALSAQGAGDASA